MFLARARHWRSSTTDGLAGNEEIRWGVPFDIEKSAYRFDSLAPPTIPVGLGDVFKLGDFTHVNRPIVGPAMYSADLVLTLGVTVDGTALTLDPLTILFSHNETPNNFGSPTTD